jgi:hypothetical protein
MMVALLIVAVVAFYFGFFVASLLAARGED